MGELDIDDAGDVKDIGSVAWIKKQEHKFNITSLEISLHIKFMKKHTLQKAFTKEKVPI